MIKHLSLKAYGKINLGLDVLGKRDDGYHQVRMVMQTVGIFDRIDLVRQDKPGIQVETNLFYLPTNENNLVYKAARLLMDEFSISGGISIQLRKFIPVSAGMAGGSSDAAAVLFGINKMFHLDLTVKQLMERGVKIGADVPYCILRGTALSEGIGEILTPLPPIPQCQVLIAKPGISVSTRAVYTNLDASQLKSEQHPDIDGIIKGIRDQDIRQIAGKLGNVLELVTIREHPVIQTIKDTMMEYGAIGSLMSGSGPTVFGLFTDSEAARHAFEEMRSGSASHLAKQVYLTSFYNTKAPLSSDSENTNASQ
ncbi:MAG: 4-(cytidine 5'-diphospho)-2-C-methyl-D-erythritol kinase [Lachnospiraceae bacterium]|jgi:4-diphosphocytidyl-2-C-methyl-D-erythritol kinase|nr:4-(cytidine 5'-diphospho)-2-C-methyl-D-erythritol kinase [Lachnospiraceae bacterium]